MIFLFVTQSFDLITTGAAAAAAAGGAGITGVRGSGGAGALPGMFLLLVKFEGRLIEPVLLNRYEVRI